LCVDEKSQIQALDRTLVWRDHSEKDSPRGISKRLKKVQNATAMLWKLLRVAEKNFRALKGHWLLLDVYAGKTFVDGVVKRESKRLERMAA